MAFREDTYVNPYTGEEFYADVDPDTKEVVYLYTWRDNIIAKRKGWHDGPNSLFVYADDPGRMRRSLCGAGFRK